MKKKRVGGKRKRKIGDDSDVGKIGDSSDDIEADGKQATSGERIVDRA